MNAYLRKDILTTCEVYFAYMFFFYSLIQLPFPHGVFCQQRTWWIFLLLQKASVHWDVRLSFLIYNVARWLVHKEWGIIEYITFVNLNSGIAVRVNAIEPDRQTIARPGDIVVPYCNDRVMNTNNSSKHEEVKQGSEMNDRNHLIEAVSAKFRCCGSGHTSASLLSHLAGLTMLKF